MLSNIIVLVIVAITDAYSIHKPILSNVLQSSSQTALSASSRREILRDSLVTASILLGQPMISSTIMDENPKTILMTGANSGIGFEASKLLLDAGHTLILPCRTFDKAVATAQRLDSEKTNRVIPAECNLADLSSIEKFSKELPSILSSGKKLDIMCLNAGIARATSATDVARTQDGFELTVGTNHLGHFYLNSLMLPFLDSKARIVVTASSVHDPQSPGGAQGQTATLGDLSGLERDGANFEMVDGGSFNADKAYKDSKLCNVLFFRELQKRLSISPDTQGISVNAFTPGLIVSTGLFRDQPKLFTKIFDIAATDILKVGETPEWGGSALAYMTGVTTKGLYYYSAPGSSKYGQSAFGNQFSPSSVSIEGQDEAKGKKLWELSAKLVGIPV